MNILLLGSGGREHALARSIAQSKLCSQLFIAPGNPGTAQHGKNILLSPTDFDAIKKCCLENKIELVVVGPEDPLVKGIYDFFISDIELKKIPVIGPSKDAAQLEGSKAFAKEFMLKHNIPTAAYQSFDVNSLEKGVEFIRALNTPVVLKADGLAAGKGVLICKTLDIAEEEFRNMLHGKFGSASERVVVEEFLHGIEMSVFILSDGLNYLLLPTAKDYKKIGEGDTGLNTGGMGAISPVPFADDLLMKKIVGQMIQPTIDGLQEDKLVYKGFIYFGLMIVNGEPFMIEYNCRMGDPETEAVLPRIESDLVELFLATANEKLSVKKISISSKYCATIVLTSGGYPELYEKGKTISGIESIKNSVVFHAGTTMTNGELQTSGGRVLAITSLGNTLEEALKISKSNAEKIQFEEKYFRHDIGFDVLNLKN
ncbi:phosphoribosylamine--glycine ligase [Bacteroidota bacterium]|nr:phosphoribosylamine--glycine ligase [Bacteroidota bacterium]